MKKSFLGAAVMGTAAISAAGCMAGALTLFNRTIPRQDGVKVDISEMADMQKWEEYKKFMIPNREWFEAQPLEHVTVKARDGITLHADILYAEGGSDKLVIMNHGYTSKGIENCASPARFFHEIGYDCLIVDHRAHGKSEGKYIGFGILDRFDCKKWIEFVDNKFEKKKQIVLYGISMGGTTVLMTAGFPDISESVKAVVSDCAFTSPYEVFAHVLKKDYHLPSFPIMNINDELCKRTAGYGFADYSTLDAVRTTKLPILFIHGKEDKFVPTYMTEQNYAACRSEKEIYLAEKAGHGAAYFEDPAECQKRIKSFLEKHVK